MKAFRFMNGAGEYYYTRPGMIEISFKGKNHFGKSGAPVKIKIPEIFKGKTLKQIIKQSKPLDNYGLVFSFKGNVICLFGDSIIMVEDWRKALDKNPHKAEWLRLRRANNYIR